MIRITLLLAALLAAGPAVAHGTDDHAPGGVAHGATRTDGSPGDPAAATRTVRITMRETGFDVTTIAVRAGETIRFVLRNDGLEPHEFSIASREEQIAHRAMMQAMPDMRHDEANAVTVDPGQTRELVWRFGRDADLEFACNIPGHAERGMAGKFRVMR